MAIKGSFQEVFPAIPADIDASAFDESRVPQHIAVIMDGNGRWAKARGMSRSAGHKAGIKAVRECITAANDIGVRYLTLYSFSTENWNRPKAEVDGLMVLFAKTMLAELKGLDEEHVRVRFLGDMASLPKATREAFQEATERTAANTGMTLALAVNYGGRAEILDATRKLAQQAKDGLLDPASIGFDDISANLYTAGMPDPDLLIRSSGECRISNFLLWQIAYSEMYITPTLWPDFDRYELLRAILDFQHRNRRFGGV